MRSNPGSNDEPSRMRARVAAVRRCSVLPLIVQVMLLVFASLLFSQASLAQDVSVRAELSAPSITRDESVTLTIKAIGLDAELDTSSLDKDFDVIGRSSSRQTNLTINSSNEAVNTSVVTWALELLPKGEGVFTVPAVKVGNYSTQLLSLTVNAVPSGAQRDIYLETSVDTTEPWVQSQVLISVRVFEGLDILDGSLDNPRGVDLQVERLGEDSVSRQTIDGRQYKVTERQFAVFPQRSGELTVEPVTLSVTVPVQSNQPRGFFSPSRRLTRRSDPITLNVQARPPGGALWWLPARDLTLANEWQGDPMAAQVGQPLTRTLVLRAEGVLDTQLPEIDIPAINDVSVYAEEPRVAMASTATGLIAEQRINWALIPQRSGTLTMPAVSIDWFNTATGQTQTSTLPEQIITVLAAGTTGSSASSASASQATPPSPSQTLDNSAATALSDDSALALGNSGLQTGSPDVSGSSTAQSLPASSLQQMTVLRDTVNSWRQLAYIALVLWVLTLLGGWVVYRRITHAAGPATRLRKNSAQADEGSGKLMDAMLEQLSPMSPLGKACREGNLPAIKNALLAWSARHWSQNPPHTLDELQMRLPESAVKDKVRQLQAALYGKDAGADKALPLASELKNLPVDLKAMLRQGGKSGVGHPLPDADVKNGQASRSDSSRLPDL